MGAIQYMGQGGRMVQRSIKGGGTTNMEQRVIGGRHGEGYLEEERRRGGVGSMRGWVKEGGVNDL